MKTELTVNNLIPGAEALKRKLSLHTFEKT